MDFSRISRGTSARLNFGVGVAAPVVEALILKPLPDPISLSAGQASRSCFPIGGGDPGMGFMHSASDTPMRCIGPAGPRPRRNSRFPGPGRRFYASEPVDPGHPSDGGGGRLRPPRCTTPLPAVRADRSPAGGRRSSGCFCQGLITEPHWGNMHDGSHLAGRRGEGTGRAAQVLQDLITPRVTGPHRRGNRHDKMAGRPLGMRRVGDPRFVAVRQETAGTC